MQNMVNINLQRYGGIPEKKECEILAIIEECYRRIKPHDVELLDLQLFENSSIMSGFYSKERRTVGVVSEDFGDLFFAVHDAWRGTTKISVCLESMELPKLIQIGAFRHEVGHSVLHGSIEYYIFPIPVPLLEASKKFGFSREYSINFVYLMSIAAKDYEVTRLLLKWRYIEDQIAYSKYVLKTSKEDLAAWKFSNENPITMAICLVGRLKDLACIIASQPLLNETTIFNTIRMELSYLPSWILERLLKSLRRFPHILVNDTFRNFNALAEAFIKDVIDPLFR